MSTITAKPVDCVGTQTIKTLSGIRTQSLTLTGNVQTNDCLIGWVTYSGWSAGDTWTDPAGWTLLGTSIIGTNLTVRLYAKVATSTDANAVVTVTLPTAIGDKCNFVIQRYTGTAFATVYDSGHGGTGAIYSSALVQDLAASATHTFSTQLVSAGDTGTLTVEIIVDRASPGSTAFTFSGSGYSSLTNSTLYGIGGGSCSTEAWFASNDNAANANTGGSVITGTVSNGYCVMALIVLRPKTTTTTVSVTRTLIWNTLAPVKPTRTLIWNVAAGTTTTVGTSRTILWNTLLAVGFTRTLLYNLGAALVEIITDKAAVSDGNVKSQVIETIADHAAVTDPLAGLKTRVQISRTLLWNTTQAVGKETILLWNTGSGRILVTRTLLWNINGNTLWTALPDPTTTIWNESGP